MSLPGVKLLGCGVDHPPSSAEVKEGAHTPTPALGIHVLFQGEFCLLLGFESPISYGAHPNGGDGMFLRNVGTHLQDYTMT